MFSSFPLTSVQSYHLELKEELAWTYLLKSWFNIFFINSLTWRRKSYPFKSYKRGKKAKEIKSGWKQTLTWVFSSAVTMVSLPYSLVGFRSFPVRTKKSETGKLRRTSCFFKHFQNPNEILLPLTQNSGVIWLHLLQVPFNCKNKSEIKLKIKSLTSCHLFREIRSVSEDFTWRFWCTSLFESDIFTSTSVHRTKERIVLRENQKLQHPTAHTHVMSSITGSQRGLKLI